MCISKRWIRNKYGKSILVNCGRCPACQQSKAIQRANRIRFNQDYDGSTVTLFVTLTYHNDCIPYFRINEFKRQDSDRFGNINFKVYRDSSSRWYVDPNNKHNRYRKRKPGKVVLYEESVNYIHKRERFMKLQGQSKDRVGVIYYKDAQDFLKRLRARFHYYKYAKSFSYFGCAEYGPRTCRPHFHFLFTIPSGDFLLWQEAIAQAWSFDDYYRTRKNIEVARNAASYAASYVNCAKIVPDLFKLSFTRQKHSYSQGYGCSPECFSLDKILESFERRDLNFSISRIRDGATVVDHLLLPKYVIHRRFPKFKGYCRLTPDEIITVLLEPSRLEEFANRLDYIKDDLHKYQVMISNKMLACVKLGFNKYDYAFCWSQIWQVRSSNILRDFYSSIHHVKQYFQAYDNINSFYHGDVQSPSLMNYSRWIPDSPCRDPNYFDANLLQHYNLLTLYDSYTKDRKIRNIALANSNFMI